MRAEEFEWEHEIRVALPVSYARTDRTYPVLWVLDNHLEFALAALDLLSAVGGEAPELILVSVGAPRTVPLGEFAVRRLYDFLPGEEFSFEGATKEHVETRLAAEYPTGYKVGGAGRFLDFLVDDVRPVLEADYRMEPDDHGLVGCSAGGTFVGFALFARPGAFARYICGCPYLNAGNFAIFGLEERYAAEHDDLPARVFFGAGEAEITEERTPEFGIASSMVKLAETLSYRKYPSLGLTVKVFPGEGHASVLPLVFSWGVRSVWADRIAE